MCDSAFVHDRFLRMFCSSDCVHFDVCDSAFVHYCFFENVSQFWLNIFDVMSILFACGDVDFACDL